MNLFMGIQLASVNKAVKRTWMIISNELREVGFHLWVGVFHFGGK